MKNDLLSGNPVKSVVLFALPIMLSWQYRRNKQLYHRHGAWAHKRLHHPRGSKIRSR